MSWFKKKRAPREKRDPKQATLKVPEGLWVKCKGCKQLVYRKEVSNNLEVCPKCGYHFRISARKRLGLLYDEGLFEEFEGGILSTDPLEFKDTKKYKDRLKQYVDRYGDDDAVICTVGKLSGNELVIAAMEYAFMGGSMGSVVGEKITRAVERATKSRLPVIIISCSGGARMQEGALSLMQMAKVSAALARHHEVGLPYISLITDPTTGGVAASYAMLGDLNIAEPGAMVGFAGPRVIQQTTQQTLPEGFQTAEFLLEHGMLDMVVPRANIKSVLTRSLRFMYTE